jgi:hypothetical protein
VADIDFDFSEVRAFAADLGDAPAKIGPFANSAIKFTSRKIQSEARKKVRRGDRSWRAAAVAINYDVTTFRGFGQSVIKSEIGYDKTRPAGALGNLREYGAPDSPSGPLAPHYDLAASLDEEELDFIRGMEKATEDATQAVVDVSSFGRSVGTFVRGGKLGDSA